jgi:serine/threonine protein kinase
MDKNLTRRLRAAITITLSAIVWLGVCFGASSDKEAFQETIPAALGQPAEATATPDPGRPILERSEVTVHHLVSRMGIDGEAVRLYAKWVVGAPVLVVSILIAMLLRPRGNAGSDISEVRSKRTTAQRVKSAKRPTPRSKAPRSSARLSDQQQVLRFFLQLFKSQHGAEPDVPAQIVRTETRPTCPNETYEMRILLQEEWLTRRMSIGLLGQGGGSRSKCFYVIYDTHLVIKIPAVPMVKFSDYKRQIEAEGRIVSRLAPRLCIVPRVSVILKAVHSFPESDQLSDEALEAKYVRLVESNAELQEHLKIDGSFALFMDLAKHYFLSTTLEEIHSGYTRLIDEAQQHPELLWDHHAFVCRYGEETGGVCNALQEIYYRCEERLRRLIEASGIAKALPTYHLRQWFLLHIVGETIGREDQDLPMEVITKANQLLSEVVRDNRSLVNQYRRQIKTYIRQTRFSQYLRQLESLASNILDLLAWIGQKGLALRDLKPENLFVAGNPEEYPAFLNDPKKYSIGLIDVETAVPIDAEDPVLIPQPQLAGTPLYATPTHLMPNLLLLEVYEDLQTILHLQDWYATIAILFRIVTGENLFGTTAHVFPEILNQLKLLDPTGPDMKEDVIRIQRLFWNSAVAEFQEGMAKNAEDFARVEVAVPAVFVEELLASLHKEVREIERTVAQAVAEQSFFNSGDKRRFLKQASAEKISQMKNKLAQEIESGEGQQQSQVLLYFELLEKLKARLEHKQRAVAALGAPNPSVSVDQLMEVMFQRVFTTMYPAHWPALAPKLYGTSAFLATDITTYQATM